MHEARPCPHCGALIPIDQMPCEEGQALPSRSERAARSGLEKDLELPAVPLLAPGSHDEVFGSSSSSRITNAVPDPILGEFVTPSSSPSTSALLEESASGPSGEAFPSIDIGSKIRPVAVPGATYEELGSEDDGDFEPEMRRNSWTTVLLASYASAVTLGLVWLVIKDRTKEKKEVVENRAIAAAPQSPKQAGLSRKVEPPEPLLGEHFVKMGQALLVGDLEIKPVEVKRQDVTLLRSAQFTKPDRKSGGKGALVLWLRLKNLSKETVFAPLDQAYLREGGKEIVDTFIETENNERIYPYPLAIESEWSIDFQDFRELRPGESRRVAIVSAPDAPPNSSGPFTWRVRLRTGINRSDIIGVRWPEE
jgi:hypothetical protein